MKKRETVPKIISLFSSFQLRLNSTNPIPVSSLKKLSHARGAALLYVLALLVIMSTSLIVLFQYTKMDNEIAAKVIFQNQTELLSESGLSFALAKLNSNDTVVEGLNYTTQNLDYWIEPPNKGFSLDVMHYGLFSKVYSRGVWQKTQDTLLSETMALAGQILNLGEFPALCLMNKSGNAVLGGNSSIEGPVLLWRGSVRKATDRKIRYTGKKGHQGVVHDSTSNMWGKIEADLQKVDHWINKMNEKSSESSSAPEEIILTDMTKTFALIRASKRIIVTSGAALYNSEIIAPEIEIQSDAKFNDCIVYASRNLIINGQPLLKGQFMASDSLILNVTEPLTQNPVFYVHGRLVPIPEKDTQYIGHMQINKISGRGIFLFGGNDIRTFDQKVNLMVSPKSTLSGLIYARGIVSMGGTLYGSLICNNLKFRTKETIYGGLLYNVNIKFIKNSIKKDVDKGSPTHIPSPLIFKNMPVNILSRESI